MLEPEAALSRREARLRAAAVTCLTGVALEQAVGLAPLFAQSRLLGVLSLIAMTLCIALGWTLAAAPDRTSRQLSRLVAVTATLVLARWAGSRARAVPGPRACGWPGGRARAGSRSRGSPGRVAAGRACPARRPPRSPPWRSRW